MAADRLAGWEWVSFYWDGNGWEARSEGQSRRLTLDEYPNGLRLRADGWELVSGTEHGSEAWWNFKRQRR